MKKDTTLRCVFVIKTNSYNGDADDLREVMIINNVLKHRIARILYKKYVTYPRSMN
jgi:hypothetical protein